MKTSPLLLAAVLLSACEKKSEAPPPQPLPVTVAQPVKREVTIYRDFPATLAGAQQVEIRARVRGILSLADEDLDFAGNLVEKDTELFIIEPDPYQQATAAAQAAVERAEATRDLKQKTFERISKAGKSRAVSELDVEIAAAELAEAEAAVAQAKAQLNESVLTEDYTLIKAPISGRMSRLLVDPGNLVGATESTLLATIIDDSVMYAYFEVPERPLIRFLERRTADKENEPVYQSDIRLKLADGSIYDKPGKIDYIENEVDPATRTARVRAVFPNDDHQLAAGLYGLVGYPAGPNPENVTEKEAFVVPSSCILRDIGGNFVWVVDDQNIVRRRAVETGDSVEKPDQDPNKPKELETVVNKGLDGTERIIVSGLQRAREGAPVTPVPAEQAAKAEE
ncbi:MexE family multidrug efflux RND transporter [Haloferula helveola]|uniref:MexE family multidrug efflux RND transporter n=1 Tax=Haloferula helveola TaxID=490095 RepID=A0ABM7R8S1_9BACT|nr:MexE family multidrug efflux RND transporter [Haloferula helveola]